MRKFRELARDRAAKPFMLGAELVTTRGTLAAPDAQKVAAHADELAEWDRLDWVSVTDNAGGNPQMAPTILGRRLLAKGKDVIVHLTCKDRNRNGLESAAWQYAAEGLENLLCLTGDYPADGYQGIAQPVFDLDSVLLVRMLADLNAGLRVPGRKPGTTLELSQTDFYLGAAVSPFKTNEAELVCQYRKLELKLKHGAQFIIPQLGYDLRKSAELLAYLKRRGLDVPVFGNIYVLNKTVAGLFNRKQIPGCQVSDQLLARCQQAAEAPDKGKGFFLELAAKQYAAFKGLGYRGAYVGGFASVADVKRIVELGEAYGPDDWRGFAKDAIWPETKDFYLYERDPVTGLASPDQPSPEARAAGIDGTQVTLMYRLNRLFHALVFDPRGILFKPTRALYRFLDRHPALMAVAEWEERVVKTALFDCQDCGDCALPELFYLCPLAECKKNQRNGPCGGSRNPACEVVGVERPCIWYRAYHRAKAGGQLDTFLKGDVLRRNCSLKGTSSWANYFLGRDHAVALTNPELLAQAAATAAAKVAAAKKEPAKEPPAAEAPKPSA